MEPQGLAPWFPRLAASFFLCDLCGRKSSAMFRTYLTEEDITMPLQKVMPHKIESLDAVGFI